MPDASGSVPWGIYSCDVDTWCAIEVATDRQWQYLTVEMGHPELMAYPDYERAELRVKHRVEVDAHVREWTATLAAADVAKVLTRVGVPARVVEGPAV